MARQVLPVNFQDDVLNASMNGKRRYMLLQQDDGSYILNDVTNYDTEGSTFGAAQINATNKAVNDSVDKDDVLNTSEEVEANTDEKKVTGALVTKQLISDLGGLSFGQDAEGNWGYKPSGADAVIPFKGDWELVLKITFGAAANNGGGTYTNDAAATDTPHGWYSSMNSTIRCVNGEITITGKCACAGRFSNQNNVAGYISNITVVSFSYL